MVVPADIPRFVEKLLIVFFYVGGSISLFVNVATLFIIVCKSTALSKEVKIIAIFQQFTCLLSNAFLTLLYIPFFYTRMGGGYCVGVLCAYVPFQYLLVVETFLAMAMLSAFSMMILVRHQFLIPESSILKMKTPMRFVAYVILNFVMHLWTVCTVLSSRSSRRMQIEVMDLYVQIRWRERGLNWFLFYGPDLPHVMKLSKYGGFVFVPVACVLIIVPFIHMLSIVLQARKRMQPKQTGKGVYIVHAQTVVIQGLVLFLFLGLPFIPAIIASAQNDVYTSTQTGVVIGEMCFACLTLLNSIVVVARNRAYRRAIVNLFRSTDLRRRSLSALRNSH